MCNGVVSNTRYYKESLVWRTGGNKKKAESGTRRKHSIATKLDNESGEYWDSFSLTSEQKREWKIGCCSVGWKMLCCLKVWFMAHVSVVHWKQIHLSRWKTTAFFLADPIRRWSKLPSITHNNAHPRLDFQFRSHHLSRYHMPDFIFPFFPDLIRKHIIQSVSKKLLEKLYVKNLGKNMRLKLMFSAVTIIDCFWKSFHFRTLNNKLKKCCMQTALRVSSFPFSLCCGNNFEGGTFESPFSSAILLQRLEMEL